MNVDDRGIRMLSLLEFFIYPAQYTVRSVDTVNNIRVNLNLQGFYYVLSIHGTITFCSSGTVRSYLTYIRYVSSKSVLNTPN